MDGILLPLLIFLGVVTGLVAHKKGYNFILWTFLGGAMFIIAFPIALLMKENPESIENDKLQNGMRKCPYCAELVKEEARLCKHCRSDLGQGLVEATSTAEASASPRLASVGTGDLAKPHSGPLPAPAKETRNGRGTGALVAPTKGSSGSEPATVRSKTKKKIDNTIVWWLAFAPVLGTLLAYLVAGMLGLEQSHIAWIVLIALNLSLSVADENKMKSAGYSGSELGNSWLIPVYLNNRAKLLRQDKGYLYVWIVSFLTSLFL